MKWTLLLPLLPGVDQDVDQQDIEDLVNLKGRWRCSEVGSGGDVRWGAGEM